MNKETSRRIEATIRDLPTLPGVAARIFQVTDDPDSSVDDLKEIISTDQVVASRILRAVNSAYYGFPRQIDTLSKAIVILGFNNVRSLALSVSIMDIFAAKNQGGLNYNEVWKHAVGTAFCARAIARKYLPKEIEKSFIAGLLHDIGMVSISQSYPREFSMILAAAKTSDKMIYTLEDETFGFTHANVGQFMADKWLLPGGLSHAIGLHHTPNLATQENQNTVFTVHVADYLCKTYNFGDYGDSKANFNRYHRPALDMFKITSKGCDEGFRSILDHDIEEASSFLNLFD